MPDYVVTWEMDAEDVPSPLAAAKSAWADLRRRASGVHHVRSTEYRRPVPARRACASRGSLLRRL